MSGPEGEALAALRRMVEGYDILMSTDGARSRVWDDSFLPRDWLAGGFARGRFGTPTAVEQARAVLAKAEGPQPDVRRVIANLVEIEAELERGGDQFDAQLDECRAMLADFREVQP